MVTNELRAACQRALDELKSGQKFDRRPWPHKYSKKMEQAIDRLKIARMGPRARRRYGRTSENFWRDQEEGLASTIPVKNDR